MRVLQAAGSAVDGLAKAVADVVARGGTVVFPTDTVYGLGCDPRSRTAVARIFELKGRPSHKPLSLHFATVAELLQYAGRNELARRLARTFLPGPLTIIVARPASLDRSVTAGGDTIGLRVPKHRLCAAILERCGPLAATSANRSGAAPFVGTAKEPLLEADLHIDDGPTPVGIESTVVDATATTLRLVREGAISLAVLQREVGEVQRSHRCEQERA